MPRTKRRFEKHDRLEALSDEILRSAVKYGFAQINGTWDDFFPPAEKQRAREILLRRGVAEDE